MNLLAFTAVPTGPTRAQLALFPENDGKLIAAARQAQLALDGPHRALLVQGDDELGAFASVHQRLFEAGVDVYASSGVTDGAAASVTSCTCARISSIAPRPRSACEAMSTAGLDSPSYDLRRAGGNVS